MSEEEDRPPFLHTPVSQVFLQLFRMIEGMFPRYGLTWGEGGRLRVRHICRARPRGVQGTLCSIIFDRRDGVVIKILKTQREFKIQPAWDRELWRARFYVQYPDGQRYIFDEIELEDIAHYMLRQLL